MGKTKFGPGFRFSPTDVELVRYYLRRKVLGKKLLTNGAIVELDIYKFHPADLPDKSCQKSGDLKWYFFCPREKKYSTGNKVQRSTESGYWKVSGKDRAVSYNNEVVGRMKTMVFHYGKKRYGERTDWIIHEYKLEDKELEQKNVPQDTYVLCILFKKNEVGTRHGDEYGAPFKEEDWSDHEKEDTENVAAICFSQNVDHGPSLVATASHSQAPMRSPLFEVAPLDDNDLYAMDQFFESLIVDGVDNQNEVRDEEPRVSLAEEALNCLEDVDFSEISEFNNDLFIELHDLIEPVITPLDPAQAGDNYDSRSNGQTKHVDP